MRILYTPLHLLSTPICEKVGGKRNLIPGGRTRPQRVKFILLQLSKIFHNFPQPNQTIPSQIILPNCKKHLTTPLRLGYNRRNFLQDLTNRKIIASGHKKDLTIVTLLLYNRRGSPNKLVVVLLLWRGRAENYCRAFKK